MSANQQPSEIRTLADLIHEAQMLSSVLYGHGETKGFIHEFREVIATLKEEHAKLTQLANDVYTSTAERIADVESSTDYILQALNRVEKTTAKLTLLDDPDRWVEHVKTSMAIRFAEDPLFERVFTGMAEAAITKASERFFTDLDRQMVAVMSEVLVSEGLGRRRSARQREGTVQGGGLINVNGRAKVIWSLISCAIFGVLIWLYVHQR